MIKGIDVSHHNDLRQLLTILPPSEREFIIIKATEGKTYRDPNCLLNTNLATKETDLIGYYHYARPENNTPVDEAKAFLSHQAVNTHIGSAILALDWEGVATRHPVEWALEWLRYVYKQTGVKPLMYCSASYTSRLSKIAKEGYGLWVAHYTLLKKPSYSIYPFWAIWQYSSKGYDHDIFNGSAEQFKRYMNKQ